MGHLPPEDLSREIERLWSRLGSVSADAAPLPSMPASAGAELAWETVSVLKTQQRRREAALTEAVAAKEESLKLWRSRAEALQTQAEELRGRADGSDEQIGRAHV